MPVRTAVRLELLRLGRQVSEAHAHLLLGIVRLQQNLCLRNVCDGSPLNPVIGLFPVYHIEDETILQAPMLI